LIIVYPEELLEDVRLSANISWHVWSRSTVINSERTRLYDGSTHQSTKEPSDYIFLMAQ